MTRQPPLFAALCGALLLCGGLATPARANDFAPQMQAELDSRAAKWIEAPVIVAAIKAQNVRTASYDQAKIDALDKAWRAEVGKPETPMITPVVESDAAKFLRKQIAQSDGRIVEVFVMDARGLNVAASAPTSDYWQGDEAKFQNSFGKGANGVDIGEVDFDESAQAYIAQISKVVTDPENGTPIGAITLGLNVDALR